MEKERERWVGVRGAAGRKDCRGGLELAQHNCSDLRQLELGPQGGLVLRPADLPQVSGPVRASQVQCDGDHPRRLTLTALVACAEPPNGLRLAVGRAEPALGGSLWLLWAPLAALLAAAALGLPLLLLWRWRRAARRHAFQRDSALSRTTSDPRPRRQFTATSSA